ncbi:hypothetical protein ACNTMW_12850 [Planosporangium sp. 12N6]|uniref:hypothetical protein n=1 Tax=Planosporangium spinosum TaxID=3402278 RepID=UPI003CF0AAED
MTDIPEPDHRVDALQAMLDGQRLGAALRTLGLAAPALADVLTNLHLRIYPRHPEVGDRSDYVVLDIHGVSIGVKRRASDLYLHVDTSETGDRLIAFEINGGGETDHPTF